MLKSVMEIKDVHIPYKLGKHIVPGIWPYLLPEDFRYFRVSDESQSTCMNCPKVKSEGFHPDIRCCTYHPRIPNFLLGLALQNENTAPLIQDMIRQGFATPEGMHHTAKQAYDSIKHMSDGDFGKSPLIACRFLDRQSKKCQIYPYRNSVCSTFFCIYDFKEDGEHFWEKLQSCVGQIETALSQWCMEKLGCEPDKYFEAFNSLATDLESVSDPKTSAWSEKALKTLWSFADEPLSKDLVAKQSAFFLSCADLVLDNIDSLYEIACGVTIRQPLAYEKALEARYSDELKKEYQSGGPFYGNPASIESLWYLLQRAHRNLWLSGHRSPDPNTPQ